MTEYEKKMLDLQVRNNAILETVLQTQIRILSKVKKESYSLTKKGVYHVLGEIEEELKK